MEYAGPSIPGRRGSQAGKGGVDGINVNPRQITAYNYSYSGYNTYIVRIFHDVVGFLL